MAINLIVSWIIPAKRIPAHARNHLATLPILINSLFRAQDHVLFFVEIQTANNIKYSSKSKTLTHLEARQYVSERPLVVYI